MMDALRGISPYVRFAHHFPAGPDWRILPRVIFDHLLLYTRDGSGWLSVDGETHRISPRSLFVIPPGILHETWHDPGSPNLMYNLHFDYVEEPNSPQVPVNLPTPQETLARPDWIRPAFGGDARLRLPTQIAEFAPAVYESAFFSILGCARGESPADRLQTKAAMLQLLAHLYRSEEHAERRGMVAVETLRRLDELPAIIEERLQEPLSVPQMAALCNLSETHFRRSFRARFGVPPAEYVARCRLERARHLLLHEAMPVRRVAEMAGYQSVHYMTRVFTRAYGVPPAAYRLRPVRPDHQTGR